MFEGCIAIILLIFLDGFIFGCVWDGLFSFYLDGFCK